MSTLRVNQVYLNDIGNTTISIANSWNVAVIAGGQTRLQVNNDGNIGIGTTFPGAKLDVAGAVRSSGSTNPYFVLSDGTNNGYMQLASNVFNFYTAQAIPMTFSTSGSEKMRIDSSGNFLVGSNTGFGDKFTVIQASNSLWAGSVNTSAASGNVFGFISRFNGYSPNSTAGIFYYAADTTTARFIVYGNGGIANYQANDTNLSDQRLKKNIELAGPYLAKICAIPVKTFLYNDQTDDEMNLGVIAQDVEAVAPELVDNGSWKDKDGEATDYLSIYQTDLQYALMKCIQELSAKNDALEARLAKLEGTK
jgi:hypothetical protein